MNAEEHRQECLCHKNGAKTGNVLRRCWGTAYTRKEEGAGPPGSLITHETNLYFADAGRVHVAAGT